MEFGSTDIFRKAIKAHAVKQMRNVKFDKNDLNRVRVECKLDGCKWVMFASWLRDHKIFKMKTLMDKHTCPMSFKNKFVNSKLITEKYVDHARYAARQMIQGSAREQYSKQEYGAELRRMNRESSVIFKCSHEDSDRNPRFVTCGIKANIVEFTKPEDSSKIQHNTLARTPTTNPFCHPSLDRIVREIQANSRRRSILSDEDNTPAKLRSMNRGSSVIFNGSHEDSDGNPRFERLYICLDALKKGWKE
ncbi:hypothetical protein Q3G72_024378 [Acer saccharum]|nr:hypothetical protein Q3G72_024378 [Acer saccharum]